MVTATHACGHIQLGRIAVTSYVRSRSLRNMVSLLAVASSASFGGGSGCPAMPRSRAQSLSVKEISSKLSKDELLRRLQVGMWYVSTGLSVTLR